MATFPALFKGAAPGTYWHLNDARLSGFMAAATRPHTTNAVLGHITHYSHPSPYLSLSFSFAVARSYALVGPAGPASATNPGYVYEIDLSIVPGCPRPLDTLLEIAKAGHAHEHNGGQDLMPCERRRAHHSGSAPGRENRDTCGQPSPPSPGIRRSRRRGVALVRPG
jgi:hypothetical protein